RVDKHTKPLVETDFLVENPSTRGFTCLSAQLTFPATRLERAHGELSFHSRWHASSLGKSEAQFAQAGQAGFEALLHRRSTGTHEDIVTQRGATGHERPGLPPFCHPLSISLEQHSYALFSQRLHDRDNVHR
ncbi:hypothetical protein M3765_13110, partial [Streptomyces thermoviolaceus]|uniref:hypothetical protein n=1 Tax=Streptomyces thermoviolaceus TaxID=1952 RepID=UPI00203D49BB